MGIILYRLTIYRETIQKVAWQPLLRGGASADEVGPDLGDAAVQVGQRSGVVDHQVSYGQALLAAGLRRHAGPGLIGRHAALPDQPLELELGRDVHHDDQVEVDAAL